MPLSGFHPVIQRWFVERYGQPTEPQRRGWPAIGAGEDALIAAPTGSGKTLAAFLACIDRLFREGSTFGLPDETRVVYVSPLKALSNDIRRNLEDPLSEIQKAAFSEGLIPPVIRVQVRTGDTPASQRQAMLRKPPHILVTTPESLYLLLTAEKSRKILETVETVIVDEIHAVARDKRGSHLSLSLERLEALCKVRPVRIGLSATQRPMDRVAGFLVGGQRCNKDGTPRCAIVDVGHGRRMDLGIETPAGELSAVCSNEQWAGVYGALADMIKNHRSTLVFVNTRRLAERLTHHLSDLLGEEAVSSHHGSLSKEHRLESERKLKEGKLKAIVATASLELGIDIGYIDLVVQIGSPRAIAAFLQRIGRSGHALGKVPKGRLVALTRDELLECAALLRAVKEGGLDRIEIPGEPLDILAQQIVAETAAAEWSEEDLYRLCRRAWPYRNLSRGTFERIIRMLNDGFGGPFGRHAAYLHHDRIGKKIRGRRGSRMAALTSGGAIPELADYRVMAQPGGTFVGTVDEDFAIESMAGDIFLLGNSSWRILNVRGGEVAVEDAHGAPPTIPFWRGEAPARTIELSAEVSRLRADLEGRSGEPETAVSWIRQEIPISDEAARRLVDYIRVQKAAVRIIPTQEHLLFERFFDEAGGMQLVIHAPFGGRINRAWGLALRKRFCRTFDFELQASADDNGILISLGPQQSFPLESVARMVQARDGKAVLEQALLAAPVFMTRWRWNTNRALSVLRQRAGKRVPPPLQRMRADDLLVRVFPQQMACRENVPQGDIPIPDHPLVFQTVWDCLHEAMDLEGWLDLLARIEDGRVRITAIDTREPSPFSYEILNANPYAFLDDAPLEERRARAVATRRSLTIESLRDIGRLDPEAIGQVCREAWPLVRNADELYDALMTAGLLPEKEGEAWTGYFRDLIRHGRAVRAVGKENSVFWIAAENWPLVYRARPDLRGCNEPVFPEGLRKDYDASEAWIALVRGRLELSGPLTITEIAGGLGLDPSHVDSALQALEAEGAVLRGRFRPDVKEEEWCARHLLARIHRMTLERLRRQIQPVSVPEFFRFLIGWHHLKAGEQRTGAEGLAGAIEQLQGFEIPAASWEAVILPMRVRPYDPSWLDELCLHGETSWARVGVPARRGEEGSFIRAAHRNHPVSLLVREDLEWIRSAGRESRNEVLTHLRDGAQKTLEVLRRDGASFFPDLLARTGLLPSQLEEALWELVGAGLVTADGFAALRSLISPQRRTVEARIRRMKRRGRAVHAPRRGAGRWTVLPDIPPDIAPDLTDAEPVKGHEADEAWARQLLERYGILFRELLARENGAPPWHRLRNILRRLEARGEIYGGRFVAEVAGEQYGLPAAVDALRGVRREEEEDGTVIIPAVDPLNLVGIITPGARVPALPANLVAFQAGRFVGSLRGGEVWVDGGLSGEVGRMIERTLHSGNPVGK